MVVESPCDQVFSLDSGHSPFFSQPENLALVLIEGLGTLTIHRTLAPERVGSRIFPHSEATRNQQSWLLKR